MAIGKKNPATQGSSDRTRSAILLVAGVCLALAGGFVADRGNLRERLYLDIHGESADGRAERRDAGGFRLSYAHPSGNRYASSRHDWLGVQFIDGAEGPVAVRYDAKHPERFQPTGLSCLPAATAGLLFLSGMALVFYAHRSLMRARRRGKGTVSP